ncbi:uncharacterized protein LOC121535138 isoform X2 [Coregonus clupeaformis]|uniref:uncharacterized protein LOC121535138 isoform X2 n=1 Tax=Coregonus clupeaformis TaxID=59861 RepID=UPI001BDF8E47|nr:uncharacterized protein LOC121535138 isoform X2 [Coregonus clupeaformis]
MKNTWENKNRLSLCDTDGDHFTVAIRKLDKSDEGNYKCEVNTPDTPSGHFTKVELKVKEDDCCKNSVTEMTAYLGGNATITCQYPEDHVNRIKEERAFTVTFTNLTVDDIGVYWCGGKTNVYTTLITEVRLIVNAPPKTTAVTTMSPASSSMSPPSPLNGTSVVIIVSVSLGGLVFAVILVIVYSCKRNKEKGAASSTHRMSTDAGNNGKGGIGDSEGIKERPLQPDSGLATTIYASDSLHYASVNFQKNPVCPTEATAAIAKDDTSFADYATVNFGQSPA